MTLKELIDKYSWTEIESIFCNLYPNMKSSLLGYKKVFGKLKATEVSNSTFEIVIEHVSDDGEEYVHVNAINTAFADGKPDLMSYSLMFTEWAEWLAMSIEARSAHNFSELEIMVHCLLEMTFCGYDEETIKERVVEMDKEVEEIKSLSPEEIDERYTTLDELKEKYGYENNDDSTES